LTGRETRSARAGWRHAPARRGDATGKAADVVEDRVGTLDASQQRLEHGDRVVEEELHGLPDVGRPVLVAGRRGLAR
jgi:hypothetical protein